MSCEYSVSRRNGKRRRSEAPSDPGSTTAPSTVMQGEDFDFDRLCDIFNTEPAGVRNDSVINFSTPAPAIPTTTAEEMHVPFPGFQLQQTDFAIQGHDSDNFVGSGSGTGSNSIIGQSVSSSDVDSGAFDPSNSRLLTTPLTAPAGISDDPFDKLFKSPNFSEEQSSTSSWSGVFMDNKAPVAPMTSMAMTTALHTGEQDCTLLALRIAGEMHVALQSCSSADSASTFGEPLMARPDRRDIGEIIKVNRSAIRRVNRILDCPTCSNDRMCIQTCYLAIQKTVAWYEAVASMDNSGRGTNASLNGLVQAQPVFMGSLSVDHDTQRIMRGSVIMAEMRDHVQPLVTRLSSLQQSPNSTSSDGSSMENVSTASDEFACGLRQQLSRIIALATASR
jgi:hypothetical protein